MSKTGEASYLKVTASNGEAATSHGLVRDAQGNFWFDVNPGRRSLGHLDTASQKITVYEMPTNMSPLGGASFNAVWCLRAVCDPERSADLTAVQSPVERRLLPRPKTWMTMRSKQ